MNQINGEQKAIHFCNDFGFGARRNGAAAVKRRFPDCIAKWYAALPDGTVPYCPENIYGQEQEEALNRVTDLAGELDKNMKLMKNASPLKANGLDAHYRLFADFNGTVLIGHAAVYGVQFVTWGWRKVENR